MLQVWVRYVAVLLFTVAGVNWRGLEVMAVSVPDTLIMLPVSVSQRPDGVSLKGSTMYAPFLASAPRTTLALAAMLVTNEPVVGRPGVRTFRQKSEDRSGTEGDGVAGGVELVASTDGRLGVIETEDDVGVGLSVELVALPAEDEESGVEESGVEEIVGEEDDDEEETVDMLDEETELDKSTVLEDEVEVTVADEGDEDEVAEVELDTREEDCTALLKRSVQTWLTGIPALRVLLR